MTEPEEFKAIQLELFTLEKEHEQLKLRLTELRLLVKRLAVLMPKTCTRCHIEMESDQFYRDPRYSDGKFPWCKECKRGDDYKRKAA